MYILVGICNSNHNDNNQLHKSKKDLKTRRQNEHAAFRDHLSDAAAAAGDQHILAGLGFGGVRV